MAFQAVQGFLYAFQPGQEAWLIRFARDALAIHLPPQRGSPVLACGG
jgi:hypothetical protein